MSIRNLGIADVITDVATDTGVAAAAFNAYYDTALNAVLSDFDWPFARKKADLAGQTTLSDDEYTYSYTYPSDCVSIRRIRGVNRNDRSFTYVKYGLRLNSTDSAVLILTDEPDAEAIYTMLATNIGLWPANFSIALSYRLSELMAPQVTSTGGDPFLMSQRMMQFYEQALHRAQATATNEERPDQLPESEWIAVQFP